MPIQVIGAGWGRTGTSTLKAVLETLGYSPCYHWSEVAPAEVSAWEAAARHETVDWAALLEGYGAVCDWPATWVWRQLADTFPEAKIVLTTRDPDAWFESATETIYELMNRDLSKIDDGSRPGWTGDELRRLMQVSRRIIIEETLGRPFEERPHEDRALVTRKFAEHVEEVVQGIDADRLLLYSVSEGWEPLCEFLGCPVPDEDFPRKNQRKQFKETH